MKAIGSVMNREGKKKKKRRPWHLRKRERWREQHRKEPHTNTKHTNTKERKKERKQKNGIDPRIMPSGPSTYLIGHLGWD